jgi:heme exporter protein C
MKPTALTIAAIAAVAVTYIRAIFFTPLEAIQGPAQKILYIHAPAAWVAFMAFGLVAVASILYLWLREDRLDRIAESSAEVGVVFTTVVLTTGPLWGKPIWGAYWTWDARHSAVLGILGALLIPFIHLSVYLFRTLHPQPILMKPSAPSLPGEMLTTLLLAFASFTLLYVAMLRSRYRYAVTRDGAHPPEATVA